MAINITTWSPDTCDCVIHYAWDTESSEVERVHTAVEEVVTHEGKTLKRKVCHHHSKHKEDGKHHHHYADVLEENQRKNKVLGHILENTSEFHEVVKDAQGQEIRKWKEGFHPEWSFDSERNLKVKIKDGLIKKDKDVLKKSVETSFLKVTIE